MRRTSCDTQCRGASVERWHAERVVQFTPDHYRRITRMGFLARAARMTAEERSLSARHASVLKHATPEQRSSVARLAACSRWRARKNQLAEPA
jgi:hypothetical protein